MSESVLTVYQRPGCGYCRRLHRSLASHGIAYESVDIWQDPDARAFVRSVANGNETVPTVRLGEDIMVNPDPGKLLTLIQDRAPSLMGVKPPRRFGLWRWAR